MAINILSAIPAANRRTAKSTNQSEQTYGQVNNPFQQDLRKSIKCHKVKLHMKISIRRDLANSSQQKLQNNGNNSDSNDYNVMIDNAKNDQRLQKI